MKEIIGFKESIGIIKKRLGIIILLTIAAVGGSILVTNYLITPSYQSQTLLLVKPSEDESGILSSAELHTSRELINTYNIIITSPRILDQVSSQLGLDETHRTLRERVVVRGEGESQVVSIQASDTDPETAMKIANSIGQIFQKEITEIMNVDNVSVLSPAEIEPEPASPNLSLNIVIGFIIGISSSVGLVFLLDYFDNTIRSEEEIEELTSLPILGSVNLMNNKIDVHLMQRDQSEFADQTHLVQRSERIGS